MATYRRASGESPEASRAKLVRIGPCVPIAVGLPDAWLRTLRIQGKTPPATLFGEALIDTGASLSAIDRTLVDQLQLPARGSENVASVSGVVTGITYPAQIAFPGTGLQSFTRGDFVALDILRLGVIAIIGRAVLANWQLNYDGPAGAFTITG